MNVKRGTIDNGFFMNSVLPTEIIESLDQAGEEKEEIIRQINKVENNLKKHKMLLEEFVGKKEIEMKESLNNISVVGERINQREKKSKKIEQQILQLKKQREDLAAENDADQNEIEKHETKKI